MPFEITIPRLGWSMEEGIFVGWLKKHGDTVRRGEPVFELEGEKAIQEIEAVDEGTLHIPATGPKPGAVLKVGAVIGYLVAQGESLPAPADDSSPATSKTGPDPGAAPSVRRLARELEVPLTSVQGTGPGGRILASDVQQASPSVPNPAATTLPLSAPVIATISTPRARRVAAELGVDWTNLIGTGAGGRVRERDVRAAFQAPPANSSAGQGTRLPHTNRRRVIAQRMVASRKLTVPVTLTTTADATNLVNLRDQFKAAAKNSALVPSYQDIITKLVAATLARHLLLAGRLGDGAFLLPAGHELHLGMAVDTDEGLLVPVLHDVLNTSLMDLATGSRRLVEQARSGRLPVTDMQGAVFTITNLGAFGIEYFTPIINVPETAILGLGAIKRQPVVLDDGSIAPRPQLPLSLTFDHKVVDGAPAARFLQDLVTAIANPSAALLMPNITVTSRS